MTTEIQASNLLDACTATLLSTDKSKDLPVLTRVQATRTATELVLTSTDRFRITRVTIPLLDSDEETWEILLSSEDVKKVVALLKGAGKYPGSVKMDHNGGDLTVSLDGSSITAQAHDEAFPKLQAIIDAYKPTEIGGLAFNPKFMIDLCKMPGRDRNGPVRLNFGDVNKPFKSEWPSDAGAGNAYFHLIMPTFWGSTHATAE